VSLSERIQNRNIYDSRQARLAETKRENNGKRTTERSYSGERKRRKKTSFWGAQATEENVILGSASDFRIKPLMKKGYVYIMANNRPTLYTGVTSNLIKRTFEHKSGRGSIFTTKYLLNKLVYYEIFDSIEQAIIREKQIKDMNRKNKLEMIKKNNPFFRDLYNKIIQ
jgi:putative endonuclease